MRICDREEDGKQAWKAGRDGKHLRVAKMTLDTYAETHCPLGHFLKIPENIRLRLLFELYETPNKIFWHILYKMKRSE